MRTFVFVLCLILGLAAVHGQAVRIGSGEPSVEAIYRFKLGGKPVAKGTLWLYYHAWHTAYHFQLSEVINGTARVRLSPDILRKEMDYYDDSFMFIAALHVPGVGWYRTGDLSSPMDTLLPALDGLGGFKLIARVHVVNLPDPVLQILRVKNADGTPRGGMELRVEPYVNDENHCGVHMGFEGPDAVRIVTTDRDGMASFTAPLADLYLDVGYYEEDRDSLGRTLTGMRGLRLPAAREHTLRQVWDRAPARPFRIRLVRPDGAPGKGMFLGIEREVACGYMGRILGESGADGVIADEFALEHYEELWIADDDGAEDRKVLSDVEKGQLRNTGELIVTWPRLASQNR